MLPPNPSDPAFVKSLNDRPGILALAMKKTADPLTGKKTFKGIPFVVPGARFNELYNWDSYFISLGLLVDGKTEMAKGMVEHFIFEIKHYGQSSSRVIHRITWHPTDTHFLTLTVQARF